jgi:hypothetical protein
LDPSGLGNGEIRSWSHMNHKSKKPIGRKWRREKRHGYATEGKMKIEKFYKKEYINTKRDLIRC